MIESLITIFSTLVFFLINTFQVRNSRILFLCIHFVSTHFELSAFFLGTGCNLLLANSTIAITLVTCSTYFLLSHFRLHPFFWQARYSWMLYTNFLRHPVHFRREQSHSLFGGSTVVAQWSKVIFSKNLLFFLPRFFHCI